jgi:cytidylate kinase
MSELPTDCELRRLAAGRREQIAIDGPAASGKSTIARLLGERLGAWYVNTGDMYRALTVEALHRGVDPVDAPENVPPLLDEVSVGYCVRDDGMVLTVNGEPADMAAVRAPSVAGKVSFLARIPEVRQWLVQRQRQTADLGLIVMEGRDIGTVVFPDAQHKFYVTASPEERARRRLAQDGETPDGATLATVAAEIAARDEMDMNRPVSPLKPADDAVQVDTTGLTIEQVLDELVAAVLGRWG